MNINLLTKLYTERQTNFPTIIMGNRTLTNPTLGELSNQLLLASVEQLEEGFSEVSYRGCRYTVTKSIFNKGKSVKVFARNSANADFISFNLYLTKSGTHLKPCEMEEEKVISFLKEYKCTQSRPLITGRLK